MLKITFVNTFNINGITSFANITLRIINFIFHLTLYIYINLLMEKVYIKVTGQVDAWSMLS